MQIELILKNDKITPSSLAASVSFLVTNFDFDLCPMSLLKKLYTFVFCVCLSIDGI